MENSYEFLSLVLDSITEHIVAIDETGDIQFVNKSWLAFGNKNACLIGENWSGVNYITECEKASALGDEFASHAVTGILSVIHKRKNSFYLEYPCHSPDEKRWFMMRVSPFRTHGRNYFVISHQNITERKLAEEEVEKLASLDGLTQIANRRAFDDFLKEEWLRCFRLKKTICLAILDLDHFKLLNDDYGHQYGDQCLIKVAELLKEFTKRPSDICARYGGEEFVLVWGNLSIEQASRLLQKLLKKIQDLKISNKNSPVNQYLTASIGLAVMLPNIENDEFLLTNNADKMLYKAKRAGRNRFES
ncbi:MULTISPECIES: diguanylate cyclase [Thalassotalea]|uniref:diguanylate cyclase n=1 Tax=Thalassotalea castellviae TaxID=3075612 RepID=A0ABU3A835_9GAMM|nr:diguanylate cyclase [Thalassotalea sp. W431]MDT0605263.1 diguanylate cyclase [Thalassotalea sp. W431]